MVELATAILTDLDNRVLFARRSDYGWWELPGAKIDREDGETAPRAIRRALKLKLGVLADMCDDNMPFVGTLPCSSGGVDFAAQCHQVIYYEGLVCPAQESGYDELIYRDPLSRQLGRLGLSPAAEAFRSRLETGRIHLQIHE